MRQGGVWFDEGSPYSGIAAWRTIAPRFFRRIFQGDFVRVAYADANVGAAARLTDSGLGHLAIRPLGSSETAGGLATRTGGPDVPLPADAKVPRRAGGHCLVRRRATRGDSLRYLAGFARWGRRRAVAFAVRTRLSPHRGVGKPCWRFELGLR